MLEFLHANASDRKLRLFACACCRGIWSLFTHEACEQAVEAAELYSDGLVTKDTLWAAHDDAQRYAIFGRMEPGGRIEDFATWTAVYASSPDLCASKGNGETLSPSWVVQTALSSVSSCNKRFVSFFEAESLRDIFGNPFRASPCIDPAWLTWNDGAVLKLATDIYDSRSFERMAELADSLAAAGCKDNDVLDHCRNGKSHVRGCWVVDLLLGKH